jgi:hypothetical protein
VWMIFIEIKVDLNLIEVIVGSFLFFVLGFNYKRQQYRKQKKKIAEQEKENVVYKNEIYRLNRDINTIKSNLVERS